MIKRALRLTYKAARRIVVTVVGFTVVLIGIILIVTPGPAFVVIPVGLAILSLEFAWARRLLRRVKESSQAAVDRVKNKSTPPSTEETPDRQASADRKS